MNKDIPGNTDEIRSARFYHGTRAELKPGDLIQPRNLSEVGAQSAMPTCVYVTTNLDEAIWEAELEEGEGPGRVYLVEITGEVGDASELTGRKSAGHPSMSLCSSKPLRVAGEVTEWRHYHGTRAELKPGDMVEPGYNSNYGKKTQAAFVYLARTLDAATWGAELAIGAGHGRIYIVEPTGPIEDDPNLTDKKFRGNPTKSFRSRAPLRVTGEIRNWQGHSDEAVAAMKEGLKRLERLGVEAIE